MSTRVREYLRQHHLALLCLFLILSGGTAYAVDGPLAGQNTVGSDDIIDGEVLGKDVRANQITSSDVRDDSLSNGGLGGADIIESSLGTVPDADALDGLDSTRLKTPAATGTGACAPLPAGEVTCAQATIANVPAGASAYVSAYWRWYGDGVGPDEAYCEISHGGGALEAALFGQEGNEHSLNDTSTIGSLIGLKTNLPAGSNTFQLNCDESDGNMNVINSRIVAIRLAG